MLGYLSLHGHYLFLVAHSFSRKAVRYSVQIMSADKYINNSLHLARKYIYYMEESVLLGTKPLVDSIRHFIRDPSGVFSVCHLCECRIVQ